MPISFSFFFFLLHLRFIVVDVVLYFTFYYTFEWIKRKDRIIFGWKKPGENNKQETILKKIENRNIKKRLKVVYPKYIN